VVFAVAVAEDPEASIITQEVGLYIVLAVYIAPLLVFAVRHSALSIRVPAQCSTHTLQYPLLAIKPPAPKI
jgi:hypothetical protein